MQRSSGARDRVSPAIGIPVRDRRADRVSSEKRIVVLLSPDVKKASRVREAFLIAWWSASLARYPLPPDDDGLPRMIGSSTMTTRTSREFTVPAEYGQPAPSSIISRDTGNPVTEPQPSATVPSP